MSELDVAALKAAFLDGPDAVPEVVGVGWAAKPVVFVADDAACPAAKRWSRRLVDGDVAVAEVGRPRILPAVRPQGWEYRTPANGAVVGGKTFVREDAGGRSGGTLSFVAHDGSGDVVLGGNVHCFGPTLGTRAPSSHFDLVEPETGRVFGSVRRWHEITNCRRWTNHWDFGLAALADDWDGVVGVGEVLDVGRPRQVRRARVGEDVRFTGASSGPSSRTVVAQDVVSRVAYDWEDPATGESVEGEFVLEDLTALGAPEGVPACIPGDSGSPVVVDVRDPALAGFVFAGTTRTALVFQADTLFEAFGLALARPRIQP